MAGKVGQPWVRWSVSVALWLGYLAVVLLNPADEPALAPIAAIPVIASGILLGPTWGVGLVLASIPATVAIHLGTSPGETLAHDAQENAFGWAIGACVAWGSGFMAGLVRRERRTSAALKQEIARRTAAEGDRDRATIRWESLLRNAPDYVALLGPDRRLLYVNRLPAGMEMAEVQGRLLTEFMPDAAAAARLDGLVEQAFRDLHPVSISTPGIGPNRTAAWFEAQLTPLVGPDGALEGALFMSRDVTAEHAAAEQVRQAEARFRVLAENATDMIQQFDVNGVCTYASPSSQRLLGYAPEEMVGHDGLHLLHPDDLALLRAGRLSTPLPDGGTLSEVRARRKDGTYVPVEVTSSVVRGPDGAVVGHVASSRDITARKQVEEALRSRESLLQETQAVAQLGSWEIDLVTGLQRGSPENRRLYGMAPDEEYTQEAIVRHMPAEDRAAVLAALRETVAKGRVQLDHRIEAGDGSLRWLRTTAEVRRDAAGTPVRVVGLSQDVTEARQQTEALRVATERFELASKATRDVLWDLDLAADRAWYSPTFTAQFGGDPPPERGSMAKLMERMHPDDLGRLQAQMADVMTGDHDTVEAEYRFRRADGGWAHVLDRAFIVRDAAGRPVRLVGAMQDVTERVQAQRKVEEGERRLKDLMDNLDEVFISDSLDGRPPLISRAAEGLFGRPAQDFMDDPMLWSRMLHPEDAPNVLANYGRLMAGEPTRDEARVVRADGTVRWMVATMRPTKDATGRVVRLDGTLRDITAEKASAAQEAKVREMKEQEAFRVRFLNTAAHELSTPLTPIKLQLASLRRGGLGPFTPRQADAMTLLDRNLNRLGLLVKDLLDATRLQGGQLRLERRPLDLAALTQDTVRSFAEKAAGDGIELRAVAAAGLPVLGDEARLTQVLFNLLSNALKYTPRGGRIVVRAAAVEGQAQVAVEDSGVGLRPEQAARLFHPFEQVLDPGAQKGGTGLGLYISRGIVEQHGGTLACGSAGPGLGSTFSLRLPLATAEAPPPPLPAGPARPA
jgi:PAS domain S-box-containing protein